MHSVYNSLQMSYTAHHINCGTMCAGDQGFLGKFMPRFLSCHCLVIETNHGLVLVDTGFGIEEVKRPQLLGQLFLMASRPKLEEAETALRQIEAMGYHARDVKHIIVTHLHLDHAGGISDFPDAKVHVHLPEYEIAQAPQTTIQKGGYLRHQWREARWVKHETMGEQWYGFEAVHPLNGDDNILMIPLPGHSPGHCGIAVNTTQGWILHCGDAYFEQKEMISENGKASLGLGVYQRIMEDNSSLRLWNKERLRMLYREHSSEIRLICSHDYDDFCTCSQSVADGLRRS
jgi:glyoxylase-like metal-dependent hydrolase (beta-lactamase superfamily II)